MSKTRRNMQGFEVGRNDLETINGMDLEIISHGIGINYPFLRKNTETPTRTQGHKNHGVAQIRRKRRNRGKAGGARQIQTFRHTVQIVAELEMLDSNTLGFPGRP